MKIILKSIATRVKKVLANLIDARQIASVNERLIGENGRLIDAVIKICELQKASGYLLIVDFKKDSLNFKFLITDLEK